MKKLGFLLKLVGSGRKQPKVDSLQRDKVSGEKKAPHPEVLSDWEGEGGRLDPQKDTPGTDLPAKER